MHPNVLRLDKCSHTKAGDPNVHIAHDVDVSPSFVFMGLYFFFGGVCVRLCMFKLCVRIFSA